MKKAIVLLLNKLPYVRRLYQLTQEYDKNACYPPGHYYSPIIAVDDIKKRQHDIWKNDLTDALQGLELNTAEQLSLIRALSEYYPDMPFGPEKKPSLRYYFENNAYSYTDGIILYAIMRYLKPKRIIEVGSGYSSAVMLDVNQLFFDNQLELTFIEPYAERLYSLMTETDRKRVDVKESIVQAVKPEFFEKLQRGDILFIDSTHVVKTGSDVVYILFEILPRLKSGVLIHFHDIFFPFEYPKHWVFGGFNWNEDYFLRSFLMYNNAFEIKLFAHYLHTMHPDVFDAMPLSYRNSGANLWLEKR